MANAVRPRSSFNQGPEVTIINVVSVVNVYNIMGVETNPFHGLMAFIFFVLIGFLQISYPDNPTAFHVHPKTMFVSIASFLLYCLVFWIKIKFTTTKIDTLMEVFGSLSIVSLVLMFLPNNWALSRYIIIHTIWFIFLYTTCYEQTLFYSATSTNEKEVATTLAKYFIWRYIDPKRMKKLNDGKTHLTINFLFTFCVSSLFQ
jgi:hypothetical protein